MRDRMFKTLTYYRTKYGRVARVVHGDIKTDIQSWRMRPDMQPTTLGKIVFALELNEK